jgi:predicted metal-binding membrane protein
MMLPSAGPMILTYAEIADTAARQRQAAVSPLVLTAGYLSVWFGFSVGAATLQMALAHTGWLATGAVSVLFAGAMLIGAGAYQFSSIKHACLTQCQRPFPFFFAHWTEEPRGVFRLGVRQGLYCLGCCWAMMLLMLATGAMNVLWMAALGALMTVEKMTATSRFSRVLGVALIALGSAALAASML